jgi:hypothetical protein
LLILMTVVAVTLGFMATGIGAMVLSLTVWMLVSAIVNVMLITAIFGRGDLQVFAIGALVPTAPLIVSGMSYFAGPPTILHGIVAPITLAIAAGFGGVVAVLTRRLLRRLGDVKLPWLDD